LVGGCFWLLDENGNGICVNGSLSCFQFKERDQCINHNVSDDFQCKESYEKAKKCILLSNGNDDEYGVWLEKRKKKKKKKRKKEKMKKNRKKKNKKKEKKKKKEKRKKKRKKRKKKKKKNK
jgi:hypothetical protein